jgi:NADPH:quinone reductase-like Zn-dependent oxidoreductase
MLWTSQRDGKKAILSATGLRPACDQIKDMEFLRDLVEAGALKTIIDRSYPLDQIAQAYSYVEKGHKRGNVTITVSHDPVPAQAAA